MIVPPGMDATSGRSYKQASQTPGALGGRRGTDRWIKEDNIDGSSGQIYKTVGGTYRLISASARLRVAPTVSAISIDILAGGVSIFATPLNIAVGQTEATGGVLLADRRVPLGTLLSVSNGTDAGNARDLTIELHYRVQAVGQ